MHAQKSWVFYDFDFQENVSNVEDQGDRSQLQRRIWH